MSAGNKPLGRAALIAAAVVFAIGTPIVTALGDIGLTQSEFAKDGNETLRVAGYAFSIWTLIYIGLAAYALFQFSPRQPRGAVLDALAIPAIIAITSCGLWIIASASDAKLATVLIIFTAAAVLIAGLLRASRLPIERGEWLWVIAPLSLLGGWLTIASAVNLLTVATAWGAIDSGSAATFSALGIFAVALIGFYVTLRPRLFLFGAPIAWGFIGAAVAMREVRDTTSFLALGAAFLVSLAVLLGVLKARSNAA